MWSKDGCVGGYAPNSQSPPWGWPVAIILGVAVAALFIWGPTLATRIIGL